MSNPTSPVQDFGSGSGTAGLYKGRTSTLLFEEEVSTSGSEWVRAVEEILGLSQSFSDFYHPEVIDTLVLAASAIGSVDRYLGISQSLTMSHGVTASGGRVDSGGGSGTPPVEAIFDSNSQAGFAVYVVSNGHVDNAQADDFTTSGVVGICNGTVLATNTGEYITEGPLSLEDWTAVTGSATLSPGSLYFLDKTTPGHLTTVAPSDGGESVVVVGRATDSLTLDIEIASPILLSGVDEPEVDPFPLVAEFDSNAEIGMLLYISSNGHVDLAQADAEATSEVAGFAVESVNATEQGHYVTDGQVTREDWTVVTGTALLSPGALYYLDVNNPGRMSTTWPEAVGESLVIVGRALTQTVFDIEINPPLLLT